MRLLMAFIAPWLTFLTIGRLGTGIACLLLQATLIGWPVATVWVVHALSEYKMDRRIALAINKGIYLFPRFNENH
jgi:hypothetical protein